MSPLLIIILTTIQSILAESDLPNILLILVDDLGNADASFNYQMTHQGSTFNNAPIPTPNLDSIANEGIRFSNHHTNWICGPSRSALITSRYAYKLGNPFAGWGGAGSPRPGYTTFAHELQRQYNYKNHFIGKWGVDTAGRDVDESTGLWLPKATPNDQLGPIARGFDTFYGLYFAAHNHYTKMTMGHLDWHSLNETHYLDAEDPNDDFSEEPELSSTHIMTREVIKRMEQHLNMDTDEKQPWFIHLSYTMPHDPLQVDDKYIDPVLYPKCAEKPNHRRKIYCGMVACVDEGIGNITTFMRHNGLLQNTIIIFSSDNGGYYGVGGYNYPFRGGKAGLFEGSMLTPSFIYSPKLFPDTSGQIFDGLIHLIDWGPTLLSLVQQEAEQNNFKGLHHQMNDEQFGAIDGMDLSLLLKSKHFKAVENELEIPVRTELILETNGWANMTSYIEGDWKLALGHSGMDEIIGEPDSIHSVPFKDVDMMDRVLLYVSFMLDALSPDLWAYGWAVFSLAGTLQDSWEGEYRGVINNHPLGAPKAFDDPRELWIPSINWNDKEQRKMIRLYNLKNDPSESNNVAMENKEKVEEMLARLNERLIVDRDEIGLDVASALHYQFAIFANVIQRIMLIMIFVALIINLGLIWMCVSFCCQHDDKRKKE